MGGFAHALGHVLKTGFDMTETGRRYNESQQGIKESDQRLADQASKSVEHWQGLGGKLIHDGLVADDGPAGPDGTPTRIYRPVNPDRYTAKVKSGKDTLQFEIPNDAEQHSYQVGRSIADLHHALTDPTATSDRQLQQTETARGAGMTLDQQNMAKESADERTRARIGSPIPSSIADALGMDPNVPGSGFQMPAAQPLTDQAPAPQAAQDLPVGRTPEASAAAAPGAAPTKRLLLPKELDDLATSAGKFVDYQSKADTRTAKPEKVLASGEPMKYFTGPDGTVTRVVNYADGTNHVDNLGKIDSPKFKDDEVTLNEIVATGNKPLATQEQKSHAAWAKDALKGIIQVKQAERPITTNNFSTAAPKGTDGKPLSGDAYLATLPAGRAAQVKAFAEGRETQLPRGKELQPFMDMVNLYDPGFTTQRAETRKSFGPGGKDGQNVGALNTAAVHLDQFADAAKLMDNGKFKPGNALYNNIATMMGGSAPTNLDGIKAAVASEMATALKGSATDQEIAAISQTIDKAGSGKQLADIVDTHLHTIGAKLNTKDEQFHSQLPGDTAYNPLLPTAAAVFKKHGQQPIARLRTADAPAAAKAPPAGQVAVINPDGVPGFIPKEKLAAALAKGYKPAQ